MVYVSGDNVAATVVKAEAVTARNNAMKTKAFGCHRVRKAMRVTWTKGRCTVLKDYRVVHGGSLGSHRWAILRTHTLNNMQFFKPTRRDPHWCKLVLGKPARAAEWIQSVTGVYDSFDAAMKQVIDGDGNDSEDVAEISLPKFPGSTEEHSFKAMKYAKFNMEATTANLDWLITFVSPDIGSGDQHGRKPRLPRSEHPRISRMRCRRQETTSAGVFSCSNSISNREAPRHKHFTTLCSIRILAFCVATTNVMCKCSLGVV
jgi:hypothetical protein